ncbi:MAG: hypothetical protein ACRDHY_05375 [Anaerolineales bacterium]
MNWVASIDAEEGHLEPGLATLVAGIGAVALGIGAANDTGWLAVTGGIVAGVGIVAAGVLHHRSVDYELFRRTDRGPESRAD